MPEQTFTASTASKEEKALRLAKHLVKCVHEENMDAMLDAFENEAPACLLHLSLALGKYAVAVFTEMGLDIVAAHLATTKMLNQEPEKKRACEDILREFEKAQGMPAASNLSFEKEGYGNA